MSIPENPQKYVTNWIGRLRNIGLELAILLLIVNSQKSYGFQLLKSIESVLGKDHVPPMATLYALLHRFEKYELVLSELVLEQNQSRARKYYTATKSGTQVLQVMLDEWQRTTAVDRLISGGNKK